MSEKKTFFSRRSIIKGAGVAAGAGIIGAGSLFYSTQPALAAPGDTPISANALDITANDGSVTEVNVTPSLTLSWSQFSSGVSGFDFSVQAAPSGGTLTEASAVTGVSDSSATGVSSFSIQNSGSLSDESGLVNIDLQAIPLVSNGALTQSALPTDVGDNQSETTNIDYAVTVTANSATSNGASASVTSPDPNGSFGVTLNNDAGTTEATGTINTDGSTGESTTSV